MKTPKDFMPPRLVFKRLQTYRIHNAVPDQMIIQETGEVAKEHAQEQFDRWYDTHIKSLFENGVVLYGNYEFFKDEWFDVGLKRNDDDTHCFLAIGIQPIDQAVTKEELLENLKKALRPANDGKYIVGKLIERIEKWGVK